MALIYEKRHSIAYLTLNRPEAHNCIDPETVLELVEAWEDYRDDSSLRCAIITEGLAKEMELAIPVFLSRDAQEGPRAFMKKREPQYQGR